MNLTEKTSYLKGLMEGMKFDESSDANKILGKLVDIVYDMAGAVEALETKTETTDSYLEEIDYDLGELEEYVYDDDDDDVGCSCGCEDFHDFDDDDDEDDEELYEIECPNCHDKIYASEDMLKESLNCPNCNEKITDIVVEE